MSIHSGPPILSTPVSQIFEDQPQELRAHKSSYLSNEQFYITYEIESTISKIREKKYARIALQFPDEMLADSPRLFEALRKGLMPKASSRVDVDDEMETADRHEAKTAIKLYILADTSYGACCVDEIAAEHIDADVVVHYGRACLSPTARIPVIHIFTTQPLPDRDRLIRDFEGFYQDRQQKIILMADVTYQNHVGDIANILRLRKFENLFLAHIIHDPSSPLPNRTVPDEVRICSSKLNEWQLYHISDPPDSLLLILASRLAGIRIYPIFGSNHDKDQEPYAASSSRALNRRYALLTSINTVSTFGILINTLSVKNYLHVVEKVISQVQTAGKKSYTFVVGKINAAKVANFSEIGAWIVIGCWESSLIDSKDFWRPVLTPFELNLALQQDEERIWTGEWNNDFQKMLLWPDIGSTQTRRPNENGVINEHDGIEKDFDSEPESAPPEFDLRTGRYVSNTRPMRPSTASAVKSSTGLSPIEQSLIKRTKGDLGILGGSFSPGAEHLRSKRTWSGLGSDFEIAYEETGTPAEEGRSGIARGYLHATASKTRT